jgi:putative endonuclease
MSNRKRGTIYIGVTSDLIGRVYQHRHGVVEGFTKKYKLECLVFYEIYDSIVEAIAAEKKLKNLHRVKKIAIIEKMNPGWADLYDEIVK